MSPPRFLDNLSPTILFAPRGISARIICRLRRHLAVFCASLTSEYVTHHLFSFPQTFASRVFLLHIRGRATYNAPRACFDIVEIRRKVVRYSRRGRIPPPLAATEYCHALAWFERNSVVRKRSRRCLRSFLQFAAGL